MYFSGGIWAVWVNRFANAGEAAVEAAGNTMEKVQSLIFCLFFCLEFCAPISEERALPVSVQKGSSRIGVGFARSRSCHFRSCKFKQQDALLLFL